MIKKSVQVLLSLAFLCAGATHAATINVDWDATSYQYIGASETTLGLGGNSPVQYRFVVEDHGRSYFFTTSDPDLCDAGHYLNVEVALLEEPDYDYYDSDDECDGADLFFVCVSCFPGQSIVETPDGFVRMDSLQVGDTVMTSNGVSPVYSLLHNDPLTATTVYQIYIEQEKAPVEISGEHLLFVHGKTAPIPASQVRVGDVLTAGNGQPRPVKQIDTIRRQGLYAPATQHGDIVVDGIVASSYVDFGGPIGLFGSTHFWVHVFFAPRRLLCQQFGVWCSESYIGGLASHVRLPAAAAGWLTRQRGMVNMVGRVIVTALLSVVYLVCELPFASSGIFWALILIGCAVFEIVPAEAKVKVV